MKCTFLARKKKVVSICSAIIKKNVDWNFILFVYIIYTFVIVYG